MPRPQQTKNCFSSKIVVFFVYFILFQILFLFFPIFNSKSDFNKLRLRLKFDSIPFRFDSDGETKRRIPRIGQTRKFIQKSLIASTVVEEQKTQKKTKNILLRHGTH